jgi:hypothetical protein
VQEVKRFGKVVYVCFFEKDGLNRDLWMVADSYFEMEQLFLDRWKEEQNHTTKG